jgi:hypothetical protein
VAEQLHQRREADPEPQHFGSKRMAQLMGCYPGRATGSLRGLGQGLAEGLIQGVMGAGARQEEALRFSQAGRGSQSAQGKKAGHDLPHLLVGGNEKLVGAWSITHDVYENMRLSSKN